MRRQIRTILLVLPFMAAFVWAFMRWREAVAFIWRTDFHDSRYWACPSVRTNIQTPTGRGILFGSFRMAVFAGVDGLLVPIQPVCGRLFIIFKDPIG